MARSSPPPGGVLNQRNRQDDSLGNTPPLPPWREKLAQTAGDRYEQERLPEREWQPFDTEEREWVREPGRGGATEGECPRYEVRSTMPGQSLTANETPQEKVK